MIQTLRQEHCHKSDDTLGFMVKTCPSTKEGKKGKEGGKEREPVLSLLHNRPKRVLSSPYRSVQRNYHLHGRSDGNSTRI